MLKPSENLRKREIFGYILFLVWIVLMLGFALNVTYVKSLLTESECSIYLYNKTRKDLDPLLNSDGVKDLNFTELDQCFSICRRDYG